MNLLVNEIFYSLQGEGGRIGEASIFIRLSRCNLKCDFCDTDFENGQTMSLEEILQQIGNFPCQWIIWTGGEPTLQLTDEIIIFFKNKGYKQAIESNGTKRISPLFDYVVCSPKGDYEKIKNINSNVDEVRLPIKSGDIIPSFEHLPKAKKYFLSPVFSNNKTETDNNIFYCTEQVKQNPGWTLSVQMHKLIGIR